MQGALNNSFYVLRDGCVDLVKSGASGYLDMDAVWMVPNLSDGWMEAKGGKQHHPP